MQESMGRNSVGLLVEVTKHHEFLDAVEEGPIRKRRLADRLDVSKKTVYRKAKRLDDHDLVERTGEGYRLTGAGEACLSLWTEFRSTTDTVAEGADLLNAIGRKFAPPAHVFRGSTVVRSGRYSVTSPRQCAAELLGSTEDATLCLPVLERTVVQQLAERLGDGLDLRLVCSQGLVEGLRDCEDDLFERFLESDGISLWRTPVDVEHGLLVRESRDPPVALFLFGPRGHLDGLIELYGRESLEWGEEVVSEYCCPCSEVSRVGK
jgi:predicted transcriptional regulator